MRIKKNLRERKRRARRRIRRRRKRRRRRRYLSIWLLHTSNLFTCYSLVGSSRMSYRDIRNILVFQIDLGALIEFPHELWIILRRLFY